MVTRDKKPVTSVLGYWMPVRRPRAIRWLVIPALAIGVLFAALLPFRIPGISIFETPNAGWNYVDRVGADAALIEVAKAISVYRELNGGQLPSRVEDVRPLLRPGNDWRHRVHPEDLLPHALVFPAADLGKNITADGRPYPFVVAVHVLGAGPMKFNQTLIVANSAPWFEDSYKDEDFVDIMGSDRLQLLKQRSYQLP